MSYRVQEDPNDSRRRVFIDEDGDYVRNALDVSDAIYLAWMKLIDRAQERYTWQHVMIVLLISFAGILTLEEFVFKDELLTVLQLFDVNNIDKLQSVILFASSVLLSLLITFFAEVYASSKNMELENEIKRDRNLLLLGTGLPWRVDPDKIDIPDEAWENTELVIIPATVSSEDEMKAWLLEHKEHRLD